MFDNFFSKTSKCAIVAWSIILQASAITVPTQKSPKYEVRGVWIATVANIDWPAKQGTGAEVQKADLIRILDKACSLNLNVVFLQVKPMGDAFYKSSLSPWSRYLTGVQGKAPEYDPLQFALEACHERGLSLHAWFNPFRIKNFDGEILAPNNIATLHPEYVVKYGKKWWLDPGIPAVRKNLVDDIAEVVSRYDIDGIHLDDYFYPYPETGMVFNDNGSFKKYPGTYKPSEKEAWRRKNVEILVSDLHKTIKSIKPWVQFGVSPFGVWRNRTDDERGSDTQAGIRNYDDLNADVLEWLKRGYLDYLVPQIYWNIGFKAADYQKLSHWWGNNSQNIPIINGIALYKSGVKSYGTSWMKTGEIANQIYLTRSLEEIEGVAFFSSSHLFRNPLGFEEAMKKSVFKSKALAFKCTNQNAPDAPINLRNKKTEKGNFLYWDMPNNDDTIKNPRFYVVYQTFDDNNNLIDNPENIALITGRNICFIPKQNAKRSKPVYYTITSVSKYGCESKPSTWIRLKD